MATIVTTVYALDMPKYVYVQLYSPSSTVPAPPTLRIRADKIEKKEGDGGMVLKIGGETVGEIATPVHAWWIQEE